MSAKDFRSSVFSEIKTWAEAAFPAIPVVYENGPVPDEDKIGPIWLDVEIRWYSGTVASVGASPRTRMTGVVSIMCFHREGEGTGLPDDVVDSATLALQTRRIGGAVMGAAQRVIPTCLRGWYKVGVLVPFVLG
jgi:hypothetical protein